jgi:apolipoprotein N-acyltransferase
VFTTHFKSLTAEGKPLAEALTGGYAWGFWALAVFGILAFIAVLTLIGREEMAEAPAPV